MSPTTAGLQVWIYFLFVTCLHLAWASNATFPYGCGYSQGVFSCDYRFALPTSGPSFDPPPQRLHIYNIDGLFNSDSLTDFNLVNTSRFDSNYDATLTLVCQQGGGDLELDATSFTYMNFYKSLHISNCMIANLPSSAFVALGSLNYMAITGGIIETSDPNAMAGLTITKDATSVNPLGELALMNVHFGTGQFDTNLIAHQNGLSILTLMDVQIRTMEVTFLDGKTGLTSLYLDNNNFTSIPDGLFTGLKGLSTLSMAGIGWECACYNLWWMSYAANNGIRVTSESLCDAPAAYRGQRAASYHESSCSGGFNCDGGSMPALNLANVTCVTYLQLFIYILAVLAFFGLSLLLICYIRTRRNMARNGGGGGGGGGGGFGGRRVSGNRIHQARNNPPNINKGGWS